MQTFAYNPLDKALLVSECKTLYQAVSFHSFREINIADHSNNV